MAPEMLETTGEYNEKIDVWAAGVILFELINGNGVRLIQETTIPEVIKRLQIRGNAKFEPHVDEKYKKLISKILIFDPKERLSFKDLLKHPLIRKNFE